MINLGARLDARLVELAWQDGLRTGLFAGVLLGALAALTVCALWRRP